jgi:endonuclease-3 related protein
MPSMHDSYSSIKAALAEHYGQPRRVREEASPFEAVLAAGLSQAADPAGAAAAIRAWSAAGMLEPRVLAGADPAELVDIGREQSVKLSSKAAVLAQRLASWFSAAFPDEEDDAYGSSPSTSRLRAGLLSLRGIGQATTDAVLLALGRPCYPVDRGSYRILLRHGWIDPTADYEEVHQLLNGRCGENPAEIAFLSQSLSRVGREFCGVRAPKCQHCPLREFLPESVPLEPES